MVPIVMAGFLNAPAEWSHSQVAMPVVWYVLANGPGVLRRAMNDSSVLLAVRLSSHQSSITAVDNALVVSSVAIFAAIATLVLMPVVHTVKRHTATGSGSAGEV